MEDNYDIDKHIAQSLRAFGVQPASDSFKAMMEKLEHTRRRKRVIILLCSGFGTIAAALLSLFVFGWMPMPEKNDKQVGSNPQQTFRGRPSEVKSVVPSQQLKLSAGPATPPTITSHSEPTEKNRKVSQQITLHPAAPVTEKQKTPPGTEIIQPLVTAINERDENTHQTADRKNQVEALPIPEKKSPPADEKKPNPPEHINKQEALPDGEHVNSWYADSITHIELPPVFLEKILPGFPDTVFYKEPVLSLNTQYMEDMALLANPAKSLQLMLGVSVEPQYSRFTLTENKRRDAVYDTAGAKAFSEEYLQNKKQMNKPYFSYAFGIKAGMAFNDHWELWLGIGMQKIQFYEKIYSSVLQSANNYTTFPNMMPSAAPTSGSGEIKITYNYRYYSAEVKRNIHVHPFFKMNIGLGVKVDQWYSARVTMKQSQLSAGYFFDNQILTNLSRWGCTVDLKAGAIYDLGKHWQFRVNPGIFYSPTSIFNREYVINQRSYGLELEALLIFKLAKFK